MSQGGTILIPFTGGAERREEGGHSKCRNRPEVKKRSSKLGQCLLGSASLFELERMWKVSCCEPPLLLLLKEPDGTAGSVDGLEVGLGSLVWDWVPRSRIIQEGCSDFQSEILTLPFPSVVDLVFHRLFPVDMELDVTGIRLFSGARSFAPGSVIVMQESFLDSLRSWRVL